VKCVNEWSVGNPSYTVQMSEAGIMLQLGEDDGRKVLI
jgi:hypothetical protein